MTQRAPKCWRAPEKGPKAQEEGLHSRMELPGNLVNWNFKCEPQINLPLTFPHTFTLLQFHICGNCRLLGGQGSAYHHHHYPYLGASGPGRHPFPMARKVFTNHRCATFEGSKKVKSVWSPRCFIWKKASTPPPPSPIIFQVI